MNDDFFKRSQILHEQLRGKISIQNKMPIRTTEDLSLAYTPGVAEPCTTIAEDPAAVRKLTLKQNAVAVISDGSAVLGLGNIGPHAAIPVMEGKAMLFKEYADIDAWPICLDTQDTEEIINTVRVLEPSFGGINLEDISAPRCFEIEQRLQDIGIPVFHDDQHGTAIVLLAALINASKLVNKPLNTMRVVINGAGAAGTAIAKLLSCFGQGDLCEAVSDVIVCDSKGAIHGGRKNLNAYKRSLLEFTNRNQQTGSLHDALTDADVFIGVSVGNVLNANSIKKMAANAIILAMANPIPEIMPAEAYQAGAAVVGTGRSDFPNQVNNVLAFPGIFKGALMAEAPVINDAMKIAAAHALANTVANPCVEKILPSPLDRSVAPRVAKAVAQAYNEGIEQ